MRRREPQTVECHQQIASRGRQATGNGDRAEQIAIVRVARQPGPDAAPQIIQPATPPVARLNKAPTQFNPVGEDILHPRIVVKQAVAIDPFQAAFFQLHGGRHKAIGTDDFQVLFVPQNQVQVIVIIAVDIAAFAAAFADRAKGNLAQATQLAQQRRIFLAAALPQIDDFAICRAPKALRLAEFALKQGAILGTRNCAFRFKPPRHPFAQSLNVAIDAIRQFARRRLRAVPRGPGNLLADSDRQAAVTPAEHLLHQQQQRKIVGEQSAGVKQRAVVRPDPYREQRGAVPGCQFDKARVPFFIADPPARQARDFSRREKDQYAAVLQLVIHLLQRGFGGTAVDIINGNKQRAQRFKMG